MVRRASPPPPPSRDLAPPSGSSVATPLSFHCRPIPGPNSTFRWYQYVFQNYFRQLVVGVIDWTYIKKKLWKIWKKIYFKQIKCTMYSIYFIYLINYLCESGLSFFSWFCTVLLIINFLVRKIQLITNKIQTLNGFSKVC